MQEQTSLLTGHEAVTAAPTPVTCLGLTFPSDAARREHFTALLRTQLQDPAFRAIEGFPHGTDEAILALSDPPYYCACPNPWIADFIAAWEAEKEPKPEGWAYHREPFAADVSEGKNDPIYNAHSYHTKVPHKAIMRYILHYTEPGDIVFDGFCGTGMTGVAAQLCGDRDAVLSLGYQVREDGTILREEEDENGKKQVRPFSKLGARKAVLNDLSPAATFIAYNYNTPVDVKAFEREAKRILKEVEDECGWMYETTHREGGMTQKGKINYTVWSDVFVCPECATEIIFWDAAVDKEAGLVLDDFRCPNCTHYVSKAPANQDKEKLKPVANRRPDSSKLERAWVTKQDDALGETIRQAKQVPVLINYSVGKKRHEKTPDADDLALIEKIEREKIPNWYPADRMMEGKESRRNDPVGITHVHHFYTKRNLLSACSLKKHINKSSFLLVLLDIFSVTTVMSRFRVPAWVSKSTGPMKGWTSGTLYVPSLPGEQNVINAFNEKILMIRRSLQHFAANNFILSASDLSKCAENKNVLDYIFLDPPFGANLNYSELNFLWESWLGVHTNTKPEAIENSVQKKGLSEYRQLMAECFKEAYRLLKPGRWMTVEFSNTKAAVWNTIQSALAEAGFIVANVAALDKQQGSFKAVTTPTAVKQDLVISAYKPNGGFEERFLVEAGTEEGVWDFVRTHMKYLPVVKPQGNALMPVPERDPRILYDQMLAYYVRKNRPIPLNSADFQAGLAQRFPERDGMYFLPNQAAEYDKNKLVYTASGQLSLTVRDEATAIQWLCALLKDKPQTFADLNPQFMQQLSGWSKNEKPLDLRELLTQNFLCYDPKDADGGKVPEQIHAYLSSNWKELRNLPKDAPELVQKAKDRWFVPDPNKAQDLEKMREKALLKEFDAYLAQLGLKDGVEATVRKLKVFRMEAVRAGFKQAWQTGNYQTIVNVAEKIQTTILEEDPKLLMWYNMAETRLGGE